MGMPQRRRFTVHEYHRMAEAGIPECWILDVAQEHIVRLTDPGPRGYRTEERFGPADSITLVALPDCTIALRDIFA